MNYFQKMSLQWSSAIVQYIGDIVFRKPRDTNESVYEINIGTILNLTINSLFIQYSNIFDELKRQRPW